MVAPCAPAAYSVCREKLCKCHAAGEVINALPIKAGLTLVEYAKLNSSATEEITIQVIGLDGKMVFESTQRIAGNSVIEIPSSTFAPGMYFLRLNAKENGIAVNRKLQIVR